MRGWSSCLIRASGQTDCCGGGVVLAAEAKACGCAAACRPAHPRALPELIFGRRSFRGLSSASATPQLPFWATSPGGERISIDEALADVAAHPFVRLAGDRQQIRARVRTGCGLISIGGQITAPTSPRSPRKSAKRDGLVVVNPARERDFLRELPVELMWGVGPLSPSAQLTRAGGAHTIGGARRDLQLGGRTAAGSAAAASWARWP